MSIPTTKNMLTPTQLANRLAWEKALLTSKKAKGRLAKKNEETGEYTYCCLGVACLIVGATPKGILHYTMPQSIGIYMAGLFGEDFDQDKLVLMNDGPNDYPERTHAEISEFLTKSREAYYGPVEEAK